MKVIYWGPWDPSKKKLYTSRTQQEVEKAVINSIRENNNLMSYEEHCTSNSGCPYFEDDKTILFTRENWNRLIKEV